MKRSSAASSSGAAEDGKTAEREPKRRAARDPSTVDNSTFFGLTSDPTVSSQAPTSSTSARRSGGSTPSLSSSSSRASAGSSTQPSSTSSGAGDRAASGGGGGASPSPDQQDRLMQDVFAVAHGMLTRVSERVVQSFRYQYPKAAYLECLFRMLNEEVAKPRHVRKRLWVRQNPSFPITVGGAPIGLNVSCALALGTGNHYLLLIDVCSKRSQLKEDDCASVMACMEQYARANSLRPLQTPPVVMLNFYMGEVSHIMGKEDGSYSQS